MLALITACVTGVDGATLQTASWTVRGRQGERKMTYDSPHQLSPEALLLRRLTAPLNRQANDDVMLHLLSAWCVQCLLCL